MQLLRAIYIVVRFILGFIVLPITLVVMLPLVGAVVFAFFVFAEGFIGAMWRWVIKGEWEDPNQRTSTSRKSFFPVNRVGNSVRRDCCAGPNAK